MNSRETVELAAKIAEAWLASHTHYAGARPDADDVAAFIDKVAKQIKQTVDEL